MVHDFACSDGFLLHAEACLGAGAQKAVEMLKVDSTATSQVPLLTTKQWEQWLLWVLQQRRQQASAHLPKH